jgi:hypothetical protein
LKLGDIVGKLEGKGHPTDIQRDKESIEDVENS